MTSVPKPQDEPESAYPRSWKWDTDGDVLDGRFVRIDAVPTVDFFTGEPVTKVLIELELTATGEPVTKWLDEAKLKAQVKNELMARGSDTFDQDEHIIFRRLGKRASKRTGKPMWDFAVWFEHAAPKKGVLDALGTDDEPVDDHDPPAAATPSDDGPGPPDAADATDSDIPF